VLMVYFNGQQMVFSRGEYEPSNKPKGLVNIEQLHDLISAVQTTISMTASEITVAF